MKEIRYWWAFTYIDDCDHEYADADDDGVDDDEYILRTASPKYNICTLIRKSSIAHSSYS